MKIVILGAGAIGAIFGSGLASSGHEVSLLGRPVPCVTAPHRQLHLQALDGSDKDLTGALTHDPATVERADLIIVTVKAGDTHAALQRVKPYLREMTPILTVQNGLGAAERIRGELGHGFHVVPGSTSQAAWRLSPAHVVHTGTGVTYVGYECEDGASLAISIARVLSSAGLPAQAVPDIEREIWRKAAVNAAVNGLTALGEFPNGTIADDPDLLKIAIAIAEEAASIARARGIEPGNMREAITTVVSATATNRSSMLQDIEAGRATETDAIHGAIRKAGQEVGVATPAIDLLHALISAKSRNEENKGVVN